MTGFIVVCGREIEADAEDPARDWDEAAAEEPGEDEDGEEDEEVLDDVGEEEEGEEEAEEEDEDCESSPATIAAAPRIKKERAIKRIPPAITTSNPKA